jgi:hypothetical protein
VGLQVVGILLVVEAVLVVREPLLLAMDTVGREVLESGILIAQVLLYIMVEVEEEEHGLVILL